MHLNAGLLAVDELRGCAAGTGVRWIGDQEKRGRGGGDGVVGT